MVRGSVSLLFDRPKREWPGSFSVPSEICSLRAHDKEDSIRDPAISMAEERLIGPFDTLRRASPISN